MDWGCPKCGNQDAEPIIGTFWKCGICFPEYKEYRPKGALYRIRHFPPLKWFDNNTHKTLNPVKIIEDTNTLNGVSYSQFISTAHMIADWHSRGLLWDEDDTLTFNVSDAYEELMLYYGITIYNKGTFFYQSARNVYEVKFWNLEKIP